MSTSVRPLCLGIAGGSGSGKSWLARYLKRELGNKAVILRQDWYLRTEPSRDRKLFERVLLHAQFKSLLAGQTIRIPRFGHAHYPRLPQTRVVIPAPLVILDGGISLTSPDFRAMVDLSVYIDVAADERLLRLIRRHVKEDKHRNIEETLKHYENFVRPDHDRSIQHCSAHAKWIWRPIKDNNFPQYLLGLLKTRLDASTMP